MIRKIKAITVFAALFTVCTSTVFAQTLMSTNYSIKWDVADGGGGVLLSNSYTLADSVAQPAPVGESMSTSYTLQAGFVTIPDTDGDGYLSLFDNCSGIANPDQYDSDGDGYGNICDPDLDNSGAVNFLDYSIMISAFGSLPGDANWNADADMNGDDLVNFLDISLFPAFFGGEPGPSGLTP